MLNMIFGAIAAATLGTQIFRTGVEDGTDLLVLSKPITRFTVTWSKIFVFLVSIIFISLLMVFVAIWSKYSSHNENDPIKGILAGYFTGTFVNFLFWGSISIVVSAFYKRFLALTVTIFLNVTLMVISIVYSLVLTAPGPKLVEEGIRVAPVCVVSKPDAQNQSQYEWLGVANRYSKNTYYPITEDSIINGLTVKSQQLNLNSYIHDEWSRANRETNLNTLTKIDFNYQLVSLFSFISTKTYISGGLNNTINHLSISANGDSTYYQLQFSKNGGVQTAVYDHLDPLDLSVTTTGIHPHLRKFLLTANPSVIFTKAKSTASNIDTNSDLNDMLGPMFARSFTSSRMFKGYNGTQNWNLNLKDALNFPVLDFNAATQNWNTKTFANPEALVKYFYNSQFVAQNLDFMSNLSAHKIITHQLQSTLSSATIYQSLLTTYLLQQQNLNILKDDNSQLKKIVNTFNKEFTKFQYWTYLGMIEAFNHPNNFPEFNKSSYEVMLRVLNLPMSYYSNDKLNIGLQSLTYAGSAQQLFALTSQNSKNWVVSDAPQVATLAPDFSEYWFKNNSTFTLMPESYLSTATTMKVVTTYSNTGLIVAWLCASFIILLAGQHLYRRKDII
ncbi:hypothetical protein UREOM_0350 [Ureaplasma sp. OM1]|uniref:ABC transporter permease n=2 Tax=Ureaplasma ceti TaxID=3119530 RepID=A0ABP9UA36_9BACT